MNTSRREFVTAAGATLAASVLGRNLMGANDRINLGYIGLGTMGASNLFISMKHPEVQVVALCDVYQPNLERAMAMAQKEGHHPKAHKDFREVLANPSVDAVCIATPDHWHALLTVEACKAGKDVYVEKPVCTFVDEAPKMVEAARKYGRVVQGGSQSRSAGHMAAIKKLIADGRLGEVNSVRVWNYSLEAPEGIGNPPDGPPPAGLDWDMWQGPAPKRPFNQNRFQCQRGMWGSFRYFWDYAGGQLTDNGVHVFDLLQMAFNETAPTAVVSLGRKKYLKDNRETPDTQICVYEYPEFLMSYEHRYANSQSMMGPSSGILVFGSKGTLFFGRPAAYQIYAETEPVAAALNPVGVLPPLTVQHMNSLGYLGGERFGPVFPSLSQTGPAEAPKPDANELFEPHQTHWANFLACIRTRQKPVGDIEYAARSAVTGLLGNVAFRSKIRVDYDPKTWSSPQPQARELMAYHYRAPWKLEV